MINAFCIVLIARAKTNQDKTKNKISSAITNNLSRMERDFVVRDCTPMFLSSLWLLFQHRLSNVSLQCPSNQSHCLPPPSRALMLCCYTTCNYYMHRFYFVIF
jgi:hypothetical protein